MKTLAPRVDGRHEIPKKRTKGYYMKIYQGITKTIVLITRRITIIASIIIIIIIIIIITITISIIIVVVIRIITERITIE